MGRTNHTFVFLIVLIFYTSLNLCRCSVGEHIKTTREGENLKSNIRRAASGLMPYPRIGRNSEMAAGFSRSDRAAGLVNYPRVGRSDLSSSNINFNRLHDMDNDVDLQFYNVRDFDLDSAIDQDYEGLSGRSRNSRNSKDQWIISDRPNAREYRPVQKIDELRPFFSKAQGTRNSQLPVNDYMPRLGRETEF